MIEADILNTSRPYIEIKLGPCNSPNSNPFYKISTVQSETGYYNDDDEFVADGTALITGANIQGVVPQGRKGSFSIKDLSGVWPNRFADIGRQEADMTQGTGPNMNFAFGWQGLRPRDKYSTGSTHINSLTAMMEAVKFDINDDGSISITVEFVAYSSIVFNDVMAFDWNDVIRTDPDDLWEAILAANDNENPTAIQVIDYITYSNKNDDPNPKKDILLNTGNEFSFAKELYERKTILECRSTGWNAKQLRGKNSLTSIEFSMPLITWLNTMLTRIVLDKEEEKRAEEEGLVVTYERKNDEEFELSGEIWTKIIYDWNAVPDPESEENLGEEEIIFNDFQKWIDEKNARQKMTSGPVLYWKAGQEAYSYNNEEARVTAINTYTYDGDSLGKTLIGKKRVLNWESDLNSYGHLFRMFKDEMAERFSELQERDSWDSFIKTLEKVESTDEIRDMVRDQRGAVARLFAYGFKGVGRSYKSAVENYNDAINLAEDMQAGNDSSGLPNKDQRLSAILAQNTFKVTAEIMGDPDLGTKFQGGNTIITTDFSYGGEEGYLRKVYDSEGNEIDVMRDSLVKMFSRQWILLETEHNFGDDGTYMTKLSLQGYVPIINAEDGKRAEARARKQISSGARGL